MTSPRPNSFNGSEKNTKTFRQSLSLSNIETASLDLNLEGSTSDTSSRDDCNSDMSAAASRQLTWGWKSGTIVQQSAGQNRTILVRLVDTPLSPTAAGSTNSAENTIELSATAIKDGDVVLGNPPDAFQTNDLISLTHLHEPAVVESLLGRYKDNQIYTYTGPACLLSINPFQTLRKSAGKNDILLFSSTYLTCYCVSLYVRY